MTKEQKISLALLIGCIIGICLLLLVLVANADAQGVIPTEYKNGVTVVENGQRTFIPEIPAQRSSQDIQDWLYGIPADDNNKWYILIFWDSSRTSVDLIKLFETDIYLNALAKWAHYNTHYKDSPGQQVRIAAFKVTTWPTVCVVTPPDSPVYKYRYVYRKEGWTMNDNANDLAKDIVAAVRRHVKDKSNYRE